MIFLYDDIYIWWYSIRAYDLKYAPFHPLYWSIRVFTRVPSTNIHSLSMSGRTEEAHSLNDSLRIFNLIINSELERNDVCWFESSRTEQSLYMFNSVCSVCMLKILKNTFSTSSITCTYLPAPERVLKKVYIIYTLYIYFYRTLLTKEATLMLVRMMIQMIQVIIQELFRFFCCCFYCYNKSVQTMKCILCRLYNAYYTDYEMHTLQTMQCILWHRAFLNVDHFPSSN